MDTCYYDNSYLKRYNCIKKYDKLKKKRKTKTLSEYIEEKKDNTLLNSKKIQEYSNYLDNKSLTNYNKNSLSLQIVKSPTNIKVNKKTQDNHSYKVIKDGYLSRNNKETVLLNRTSHGYETLNKKKDFDVVSITRPIYWPERGYREISKVKDPNVNNFQTCYF